MKLRLLVSPVVLAGTFLLTHAAHANTISTKGNSPTQVQGRCGNTEGGVYFPPTKKTSVYGCMNADGSGIICGGTGKYAKTCDTWGPSPNIAKPNTATKPTQEDFDKHAAGRQ
jgi:hypothetical protein